MKMTDKEELYWKYINHKIHDSMAINYSIHDHPFMMLVDYYLRGFSDLINEDPVNEDVLHIIFIKKYSIGYEKMYIYSRTPIYSNMWECRSVITINDVCVCINDSEKREELSTEEIGRLISEDSKYYISTVYKYSERLIWLDNHAIDILNSALICKKIKDCIYGINIYHRKGMENTGNILRLKFNIDILMQQDLEGKYINDEDMNYLTSHKEEIKSLLKELGDKNDNK